MLRPRFSEVVEITLEQLIINDKNNFFGIFLAVVTKNVYFRDVFSKL